MSLQPVTLSALFLTRAPIQIHNIHLKDRISSTTNLFGSRDDDEIDDMSFSFSFQSPSPVDNNTKEQIVPTSYVLLTVLINFFLSETSSTLFDALFFGYILLIKSLPLSSEENDIDDAKGIETSYFLSFCGSLVSVGIISPEGLSLQAAQVKPISILLLVALLFIYLKEERTRQKKSTVIEENPSRELMREWDKKFSDLEDNNDTK